MPAVATDARRRLLAAALQTFRSKGYHATTVDDLCAAAGVSKGSFFHHFDSKEDLALGATRHWNEMTGALFASAPYQQVDDPRERLLAYIDFRAQLLQGELHEFTCLLGTLVQETFATHPGLRDACGAGIQGHAATLCAMIAAAKARHAAAADWTPESLALYTQAALQGAFVLAKGEPSAERGAALAAQCVEHLRRYVQLLLPQPTRTARAAPRRTAARSPAKPATPAKKGARR
jgi:TetR/AcrR family transcriptional repressor of nem operon